MSLFPLINNQSNMQIWLIEALPYSCSRYSHFTVEHTTLCSVHRHKKVLGLYNSSRETYHQARNRIRVTRLLGMCQVQRLNLSLPSPPNTSRNKMKMPQSLKICRKLIFKSLQWQYLPSFGSWKLVWLFLPSPAWNKWQSSVAEVWWHQEHTTHSQSITEDALAALQLMKSMCRLLAAI